jgi:hypothetical protein
MKQFRIETYRVSTFYTQAQDGVFLQRKLELVSVPLFRGMRYEANLTFVHQNPWSNTAAGFLLNEPFGVSGILQLWPHINEFPIYYDMLRNEQPVYFYFEPGRRDGNHTDIITIGIGTTVEPPGEGGQDTSPSPFLDLVELPLVVQKK